MSGVQHRKHSRDDGYFDSFGAGPFYEIKIKPVVIKQLSHEKLGPVFYLHLDVFQVGIQVYRLGMTLWVASGGHAELVVGHNMVKQVCGVLKSTLHRDELRGALGGVATQGDDVLHPFFLQP